MMPEVTVVGTGGMGAGIARNLLKAGFKVSVWNRSRVRLAPLEAAGARVVDDVQDIFTSGIVLSVLADDVAVKDVFLLSGALKAAPRGSLHVNLATISPSLAATAETIHTEAGVGYLAAPMFGGIPVAEAGNLNIVAAGNPDVARRVKPFLEAVSARVWPVGEIPSQANVVKVAGQVLIASAIQAMSEAIAIGERGGVDARTLVELFTSTITPGPVYTNYGGLIASEKYVPAGFTPVLGRKDVDLARVQAATTNLRIPMADLLYELLTESIRAGHEQDDWASLADMQRHRDLAGTDE